MPHRPDFSWRTHTVLDGEFGRAPASAARAPVRLHIGDSDVAPGTEFPLSGELDRVSPWWYRYPAPVGAARLRRALAGYYAAVHGLPTEADQVLVTPGATSLSPMCRRTGARAALAGARPNSPSRTVCVRRENSGRWGMSLRLGVQGRGSAPPDVAA